MLVVLDPAQVHSSVEYVPPRHVPERDGSAQRNLCMRSGNRYRCIVVDAEDLSQPKGYPVSVIGDSPSGNDSVSESGSGSGSGSDASDADTTSSAVTVSSYDLEAAAPAAPPQKSFRGTAPHSAQGLFQWPPHVVVDVDAASSSAPVIHLLSEGDFFPTNTEAGLKHKTKP